MNTQPIHVRSNRDASNLKIFLLFIPSLIFFWLLLFLATRYKNQNVAETTTAPTILGTEAQSELDKTK